LLPRLYLTCAWLSRGIFPGACPNRPGRRGGRGVRACWPSSLPLPPPFSRPPQRQEKGRGDSPSPVAEAPAKANGREGWGVRACWPSSPPLPSPSPARPLGRQEKGGATPPLPSPKRKQRRTGEGAGGEGMLALIPPPPSPSPVRHSDRRRGGGPPFSRRRSTSKGERERGPGGEGHHHPLNRPPWRTWDTPFPRRVCDVPVS